MRTNTDSISNNRSRSMECIIRFYCVRLSKIIKATDQAIPNPTKNSNLEWICDCGIWTNGDDTYHIPLEKIDFDQIDIDKSRTIGEVKMKKQTEIW